MNLADISKLPPAMQRAALADQARASAARERIMAQVSRPLPVPVAAFKADPALLALPLKSPPKAVSAAMQAILPQCPGVKQPKAKAPKQSESKSQQEVVRWWRDNSYEWHLDAELLFAIPNQARRSRANASRMSAEGLLAGVPDVFLAVPRGDCAGFFIEMKASGGKLSENQRLMLARLTKAGYATLVAYSATDAINAIRAYMNLPTPSRK